MSSINKILRSARIAAGLTAQQVADRMGISRCYLSNLELADSYTANDSVLDRWASVLGLDPLDVFMKAGRIHPNIVEYLKKNQVRFYELRRMIAKDE